MSEDHEHEEADKRDEMCRALLGTSTDLYMSDPAFFSRCQLAVVAVNWSVRNASGSPMDQVEYAIAMQTAAVALVLAGVSDEDIAETVDGGRIAVAMLEFSMQREALAARIAAEEEQAE